MGKRANRNLEIGKPVPELVLPALSGEVISINDFRGKPMLVSFLSHAA